MITFVTALAFLLHVFFVVVWVGGMFFAYLCLRPAAAQLPTPERVALWGRVLGRFFNWVLLAVPAILASGLWMAYEQDAFDGFDPRIHVMMGIGILMMLLFLHVYFAPFRRLQKALAANDAEAASRQVASIRKLVALNLALGIVVVAVATAGKYLLV
jgi:uncharacterized membrane protein